MGGKKVTIMVLKVDLNCEKCRKKVKKILCIIPQIQDQVWDEKKNTVTIKMVCCSPEKIREMIICKGGDSIKSIEIVVPKPDKKLEELTKTENGKESEKTKEQEKTKESEKTKEQEKTKESEKTKEQEKSNVKSRNCCSECNEGVLGGPCFHGHGGGPPPHQRNCCSECYEGVLGRPCFHGHGGVPPSHQRNCCSKCYEGIPGGPCFHGHQRNPVTLRVCCLECYEGVSVGPCFYEHGSGPPPSCYQYNVYMGRPVYDSYEGGGQGCSVM